MVRFAVGLARLAQQVSPAGRKVHEIVLGVPVGAYDEPALLAQLRVDGDTGTQCSVRPFTLRTVASTDILLMRRPLPRPFARCPQVQVPDDGSHGFRDCDAAILIPPFQLSSPILLDCPYITFMGDLLLRYVAAFLPSSDYLQPALNAFLTLRAGRAAFATTPATVADIVGYAGVRASNAVLVPALDALPALRPPPKTPGRYILWITNTAAHKNHRAAVAALELYYGTFAGTLPVIVAGEGSDALGLMEGRLQLHGHAVTKPIPFSVPQGMLDVRGYVSDHVYDDLVTNAAIIWHNVIADNGTYVAIDAAVAGRHLVTSDYPQMRYWCDHYGIDARFFPAHDPLAAARALSETAALVAGGAVPAHALRPDDPSQVRAAYTALLERLL